MEPAPLSRVQVKAGWTAIGVANWSSSVAEKGSVVLLFIVGFAGEIVSEVAA